MKLRKHCKWVTVVVASSIIWFVAGCGQGETPPESAQPTAAGVTVLTITLNDSYYGEQDNNSTTPPQWEVPAGGYIILNMENHGQLEHNWAIVKKGATPPAPYKSGQGGDIILYGAGMVYSQNKTTVTLVAPSEPGEYIVMCTVENHYPLMQGRLLVK